MTSAPALGSAKGQLLPEQGFADPATAGLHAPSDCLSRFAIVDVRSAPRPSTLQLQRPSHQELQLSGPFRHGEPKQAIVLPTQRQTRIMQHRRNGAFTSLPRFEKRCVLHVMLGYFSRPSTSLVTLVTCYTSNSHYARPRSLPASLLPGTATPSRDARMPSTLGSILTRCVLDKALANCGVIYEQSRLLCYPLSLQQTPPKRTGKGR